jgi:hypothetical protein
MVLTKADMAQKKRPPYDSLCLCHCQLAFTLSAQKFTPVTWPRPFALSLFRKFGRTWFVLALKGGTAALALDCHEAIAKGLV